MKQLTIGFYKEMDGKWYADVDGVSKEECEMVCGADTMLDVICEGSNRIQLCISTDASIEDATLIKQDETEDGGCNYTFTSWNGIPFQVDIWLCVVNTIVFGYHPSTIKITKV